MLSRTCPETPTFCFELFLYEMINLIEKYEPFTHSSYIGIYLVSIAFFSFMVTYYTGKEGYLCS